jgi:hypothetical protein
MEKLEGNRSNAEISSVCSYCARLADEAFLIGGYREVRHLQSVTELLASSASCSLCRLFVDWLGEECINTLKAISDGGYRTWAYVEQVDSGPRTAEVDFSIFKTFASFVLGSPISRFRTKPFLLGSLKR